LLPVAAKTAPASKAIRNNSPDTHKAKSIVVVLGMPRSGTSLLTSLLQGLGVELGENLAVADANNPAGYWEQEEICQAQEQLLQHLGRRWIDETGTMPFPEKWWQSPELKQHRDRLASIVRSEVLRCNGLWGFKDPRTSRLIPLWNEIFAELNFNPIYILALRDPASAVQSMVKLYDLPAARTELLWLLHTLDAVQDAGDRLRLVVDYDRWFSDPRAQALAIANALSIEWPADEGPLLSLLQERIRPDLRHCNSSRPALLPFSAEVFTTLQTAAVTKEIPENFQSLARDVHRAISLCSPWSAFIENATRPAPTSYSFVENFPTARMEGLGPEAGSAIWEALIDGPMQKALFLHPPARLHFHVPDGRRARLTFAVNIHPHAWNKPNAGGCEFIVTVDDTVRSAVRVDPVHVASDRRWHECTLEIPENLSGEHVVIFETKAWGDSLDFRWAVWRDPRLTWSTNTPELPKAIFGE